jgi:hypothetical protein
MTKLTNISRLSYLTVALVASAALMGSAHIANAKGDHHQRNNSQGSGARPHFVISGQPASVKRVLHTNKKKEMTEKKKKGCGNIIVPTAECGVNPKNPVGSTRPTLPTSQAPGGNAGAKGPSPAFTTVTLSNGVTNSAIFNGKGLTVTSNSPGTITVSNGTNSVTMPGGSMNLSGAVSVQAGAGTPAKPTAGANNGPPGVTFTDDLKSAGKAAGNTAAIIVASPILAVGAAGVTASAALSGIVTGHPIQSVKEVGGRVVNDAIGVLEWVGGWF